MLAYIEEIFKEHGSDVWFSWPVSRLLPSLEQQQAMGIQLPDPSRLVKGNDTMDVWFDSGTSWAGVLKYNDYLKFPADLYLEGSDQTRGWFQSSLLTAVAATGQPPYKKVLTHGFVLDEKGFKMSKSLGTQIP